MGYGREILQKIYDHNTGKSITLAENAFKQAQNLLSKQPTFTKDPPVSEALPEIAPVEAQPLPPLQQEATTTPLAPQEKIMSKEVPTEPSNQKDKEDFSISKYNNPGNIQQGENWNGVVKGKGYGPKERFAIFKTPEAGIRALKIDLTTKLERHKGNLKAMIAQYAPASENNVTKYLEVVQQFAGKKEVYTSEDINNLVKGFISMENKPEMAKQYIALMENA